jgi:hypothetical protein
VLEQLAVARVGAADSKPALRRAGGGARRDRQTPPAKATSGPTTKTTARARDAAPRRTPAHPRGRRTPAKARPGRTAGSGPTLPPCTRRDDRIVETAQAACRTSARTAPTPGAPRTGLRRTSRRARPGPRRRTQAATTPADAHRVRRAIATHGGFDFACLQHARKNPRTFQSAALAWMGKPDSAERRVPLVCTGESEPRQFCSGEERHWRISSAHLVGEEKRGIGRVSRATGLSGRRVGARMVCGRPSGLGNGARRA